jgi:hypothetical protein
MNMRLVLVVAGLVGCSIGGLVSSVVGADLLNDVKGVLPGDKEFYKLMFKHFLPQDRFRFWREIIREHRRLFPKSRRVPVFVASLALAFCSFLGLVTGVFNLR